MSDFIYIKNEQTDEIGDQYDFYMAFTGSTPVADPTKVAQWNTFFGTTNLSAVTDISDANLKRYYFSGACDHSDRFEYPPDCLVEFVNKITDIDTSLGAGQFYGQSHLRYVRIDNATLGLGGGGFSQSLSSKGKQFKVYYPSMTEIAKEGMWDQGIIIKDDWTWNHCFPKVTKIKFHAFGSDDNIYDIYAPNLTTIEDDGLNKGQNFERCSNLRNFLAPNLTRLADDMFSYCVSLTNIDISKVTTWGSNVFQGISGNTIDVKMLQSQSGNTNITYLTTNNTVNFTWA